MVLNISKWYQKLPSCPSRGTVKCDVLNLYALIASAGYHKKVRICHGNATIRVMDKAVKNLCFQTTWFSFAWVLTQTIRNTQAILQPICIKSPCRKKSDEINPDFLLAVIIFYKSPNAQWDIYQERKVVMFKFLSAGRQFHDINCWDSQQGGNKSDIPVNYQLPGPVCRYYQGCSHHDVWNPQGKLWQTENLETQHDLP